MFIVRVPRRFPAVAERDARTYVAGESYRAPGPPSGDGHSHRAVDFESPPSSSGHLADTDSLPLPGTAPPYRSKARTARECRRPALQTHEWLARRLAHGSKTAAARAPSEHSARRLGASPDWRDSRDTEFQPSLACL